MLWYYCVQLLVYPGLCVKVSKKRVLLEVLIFFWFSKFNKTKTFSIISVKFSPLFEARLKMIFFFCILPDMLYSQNKFRLFVFTVPQCPKWESFPPWKVGLTFVFNVIFCSFFQIPVIFMLISQVGIRYQVSLTTWLVVRDVFAAVDFSKCYL